MSDDRPPDFAMARAAEILYELYERQRRTPASTPPPALERVAVLFNETIALDVTKTTRAEVERELGIAFAYPIPGWHTYCVRGNRGREFVSLFYAKNSGAALLSAELYLPKVERAPALAPRPLRFRIVPGEVAIGTPLASLGAAFGRIEMPAGLGSYDDILAARFPGGSVYAMGSGGTIERLALYALRDADRPPRA